MDDKISDKSLIKVLYKLTLVWSQSQPNWAFRDTFPYASAPLSKKGIDRKMLFILAVSKKKVIKKVQKNETQKFSGLLGVLRNV